METDYILRASECDTCVMSKEGFYNPICAHCPSCSYTKKQNSSWMSIETAEMLRLLKPEEF